MGYSSLSKEEWKAVSTLADDRKKKKKNVDKGLCVIIWDRNDYITDEESQLKNKLVYKKVFLKQDMLTSY